MNTHAFSDSSFDAEVLKNEKPVLVDFWAEWCQPCKVVGPVIDDLAKEYGDKLKVGKMNVDENLQVPGSFGVMSIPTIMMFKGGKPVKTLIGVQNKDTYKKAIDEAIMS